MKQTKIIMGMPISLEIAGRVEPKLSDRVFKYFRQVDKRYSTYKPASEISRINRGLARRHWSSEMKQVLALCEQTKQETDGFFDIRRDGRLDPSGLVKGWSVRQAAKLLLESGVRNFMLEAGGDIEAHGCNPDGKAWRVGIRNPFNRHQNVKVVEINGLGIATSGAYIRGNHIYNPKQPADKLDKLASVTVIAPDIYDADRMATAAYAMGESGIGFIQRLKGFEGYFIDSQGLATMTSGFERYVLIA